ncbi:hypothetical protein O3627_10465 [Streptococcus sp. 27098_8_82]|uniref:hypothetical protein n=1 Tax=Streptococcus sp. 27098_8_82 TaxID=3003643 RepID=UPI00352C5B34
MANSSYTVEAVLRARDSGFSNAMRAAERSVSGLSSMAEKTGSVFKSVLGANIVSSALISGVQQLGGSIKGVFSSAIEEGGKLQQSLGGIETLFKGSADKVKAYADQAFRTAGVSANAYMESVTSFSASLLQSLGGDTEKAADVANRAMIDMSDNANKMGTNMELIQNAYQGFAKDNFTMLDNLKLGYGGTKTEMQRLIKDAAAMTDVQKELNVEVKDGDMSFGNMVNAISVMQKKLGITGTTAKEAATTLSGSLASMKASWSDLLGKLALGSDIGPALKNLISTTSTFLLGNFIPMVGNIMKQLPQAISGAIAEAGPQIEQNLKGLMSGFGVDTTIFDTIKDSFRDVVVTVETVFATLTNKANGFNDVISGVGNIVKLVNFIIQDLARAIQFALEAFAETGAINNAYKAFKDLTEAALDLAKKLSDVIPWDVVGAAAGHLINAISTIISWISKLSQSISKDVWSGLIAGIGGGVLAFKAFNFLKSFNPFAIFRRNAVSDLGGASSVVSSGVSKIAQIFKSVGFAIKAALSGVSQVILAFGAALKTAGVANILAFGGAVAIAAVGIGAGVAIIAAGFALLATQSEGISAIIGAVGQAFSAVATAIIGAFAQAIVTVAGVLPTVTSALAGLSPLVVAVGTAVGQAAPFVTALGQALSSIISVLPPVITALSEGAAAIISALTPIVEIVGNVFTNIAQIVADAIVRIVQALSPFMPAVSEMVQALAPVLQSIVEAFTTLVSQISPIIDSIANLFKSLGESIKTVLDGAKGVIESFGGAVRNILDGISGIFDAIGNAALNAGKGFKLMAEGVVMITKTNLGDMAASLAAVATGIGAIAANGAGIATAGNGMKALGQGMAMVQAYSAGASASLMSVSAVLPALASGFSALAPVVASAVARSVTSVQSGMTLIVTVIVSSAARMTAAGQQAGQGVSRGIVNGIRAGVGQATAAMNNLMLSVQRVGNIGARNMLSVGAQIGNGLARGMIAALPAVTSAAQALVEQAEVAAKAKAIIKSPSRLFRDNVGIYIGQGIAVGIDRSQKYVNEALENLYDVKGKFDYSDLLDDGLKQHGYTANLNGSLTLESKQSDQKLDIIKDALNTIKQSLDREVVLNVNGQEFARLTGDDFSRYQSDREYISNILKGVRV